MSDFIINNGDTVIGKTNEIVYVMIKNNKYRVYSSKFEFMEECIGYDDFFCFMDNMYFGIKKVIKTKNEDIKLLLHAIERMEDIDDSKSITLDDLMKTEGFDKKDIAQLEKEIEFEEDDNFKYKH